MKQRQLIEDALESIHAIRAEVHGDVESCVLARLDNVIEQLEEAQRDDSDGYTVQDILLMLGRFVEFLPAIAQLLKYLRSQ